MGTASATVTPESGIDRETLLLGLGDVTIVAAFVLAGLVTHEIDPIGSPLYAIETVVPFVVGWLAIAPLAGVYGLRSHSIGHVVRVITVAWIAAANVGLMLRSSSLFGGGAEWPFALVMTGFGLLVLVGWRVCYAVVRNS